LLQSTVPPAQAKALSAAELPRRRVFSTLIPGRFYRAITWKVLSQGKGINNPKAIIATAADIRIELSGARFLVDGVPRTEELHTPEVDAATATVSAIPEVRIAVNRRLKQIAGRLDVVVEGRDMSTVVFPDAEIKIFLDADADERARRRVAEREGASFEAIREAIIARDRVDREKKVGKLQRSDDAVYIDTTDLTIDQVCEKVIAIIHDKKPHGRSS
jgi:cytidylate kinase